MNGNRRTEALKLEVVKHVTERGYPVAEVATLLTVSNHKPSCGRSSW